MFSSLLMACQKISCADGEGGSSPAAGAGPSGVVRGNIDEKAFTL